MNAEVDKVSNQYPAIARQKFNEIRELVYQVGAENDLGPIDETLKWGQPAYLCKSGSTIRVDWRAERPEHIELLFNCKSILVETFREVFGDELIYQGNRIVLVLVSEPLPKALSNCIYMALNYHKLKKRPLLGA